LAKVSASAVLGPRLFILYTTDLADVTEKHRVTLCMRLLMTHNYTCTVAVMTWRRPLHNSSNASLMSAAGCLPIDWSWMPTKLSH